MSASPLPELSSPQQPTSVYARACTSLMMPGVTKHPLSILSLLYLLELTSRVLEESEGVEVMGFWMFSGCPEPEMWSADT